MAASESQPFLTALPRTNLRLTGPDRVSFLQNFCTNDIAKLQPGEGCEAFICNAQGKTLAFASIFISAEFVEIETVGNQAKGLIAHLDRYLIREDVEFNDVSSEHSTALLFGDQGAAVLADCGVSQPPTTMYSHVEAIIAEKAARISRVDFVAGDAWLITTLAADFDNMMTALKDAGATRADVDTYDRCRIQHGYPEFGSDVSDENLPQEVDRDATAISFTKGCYLGQETVARIDAMGHVNRKIRRIQLTTSDTAASDETSDTIAAPLDVEIDGKRVIQVTSIAPTVNDDGYHLLGYVRSAALKKSDTFESPIGVFKIQEN